MQSKKLTPLLSAPVKRENFSTGTIAANASAIVPADHCDIATRQCYPFAADSAE